MKTTYNVEVVETSKELRAKERVAIKDFTNAIALDDATQRNGHIVIDIDYYAVLNIHNEKSKDKDYCKYVVVDKAGNKYITGSLSFFNALTDIIDEMEDADEEYSIDVYRVPSKNYSGKDFITCSIV